MKTLHLIRHAKSSWKNPELPDFERPLNKRGRRNAPEMGKRLFRQRVIPDCIVTSPATRALVTARYIARELNFPHENLIQDPLIYAASKEQLIGLIQQQSPLIRCLFLVGHNPELTETVNALAGKTVTDNVVTAGIVSLGLSSDSWEDIAQPGLVEVLGYDYPKKEPSG